MSAYKIGDEVQFRRKVTETNPDRVINEDEKGRILAIAPDGSYTVKLQAGDAPFSGITDDDVEPALDTPDDDAPVVKQAPPAPAAAANADSDESDDSEGG